jgi:hypothetical protein
MAPRIETLTGTRGEVCVYYDNKRVATVEEKNGFWYAHYYTGGYSANGIWELNTMIISESEAHELFASLI